MLVELVRTESTSDIYLEQLKNFPGKARHCINFLFYGAGLLIWLTITVHIHSWANRLPLVCIQVVPTKIHGTDLMFVEVGKREISFYIVRRTINW
jgi:hypothetical protein